MYRIDIASLEIDLSLPGRPGPPSSSPSRLRRPPPSWCPTGAGFDVTIIGTGRPTCPLGEIEVGRYPRGIAGDERRSAGLRRRDWARPTSPCSTCPPGRSVHRFAMPGSPRLVGYDSPGSACRRAIWCSAPTTGPSTPRSTARTRSWRWTWRPATSWTGWGPGTGPRSMDISDDGTALYMVNYRSDTMYKIRAGRPSPVLQRFDTAPRPIGITYDPAERRGVGRDVHRCDPRLRRDHTGARLTGRRRATEPGPLPWIVPP